MKPNRRIVRDFGLHSDRSALEGTAFMEIGPGRYSGTRWKEGSVTIGEDSFVVLEGIVKKHYKKYYRDEINNISRTTGRKIASNMREAAEGVLACAGGRGILDLLEYRIESSPQTIDEFIKSKAQISKMLMGLADYMDGVYEDDDWICMLGGGVH